MNERDEGHEHASEKRIVIHLDEAQEQAIDDYEDSEEDP